MQWRQTPHLAHYTSRLLPNQQLFSDLDLVGVDRVRQGRLWKSVPNLAYGDNRLALYIYIHSRPLDTVPFGTVQFQSWMQLLSWYNQRKSDWLQIVIQGIDNLSSKCCWCHSYHEYVVNMSILFSNKTLLWTVYYCNYKVKWVDDCSNKVTVIPVYSRANRTPMGLDLSAITTHDWRKN